jgi:outer membrane receptor for Fe3+-dicitrate
LLVSRCRIAALLIPLTVIIAPRWVARASESVTVGPELQAIVVTATAIPGTTLAIDKVPGNVQVLSATDLTREGSASLTAALNSNLSSININDDLDDPFQPDILYRGFEASPVLGTPQGLAVYQNGVRINEAFGDTVNWDLFPDIAINQVELVSSSPVYGLNALGGAISVTMKNGFTYQGRDVELSGGSYGQRAVTAQYGVSSGALGFYLAGRALDWDGWREFSNDRMRDLYAAFSAHMDTGNLDLSFTRADDRMNGQGSAPVQELAVNRSLVFTGFRGARWHARSDGQLVAAERNLLPPVRSVRRERQLHRLRGLHHHGGYPLPAGRRDSAHEFGGTNPSRHLQRRHDVHR